MWCGIHASVDKRSKSTNVVSDQQRDGGRLGKRCNFWIIVQFLALLSHSGQFLGSLLSFKKYISKSNSTRVIKILFRA